MDDVANVAQFSADPVRSPEQQNESDGKDNKNKNASAKVKARPSSSSSSKLRASKQKLQDKVLSLNRSGTFKSTSSAKTRSNTTNTIMESNAKKEAEASNVEIVAEKGCIETEIENEHENMVFASFATGKIPLLSNSLSLSFSENGGIIPDLDPRNVNANSNANALQYLHSLHNITDYSTVFDNNNVNMNGFHGDVHALLPRNESSLQLQFYSQADLHGHAHEEHEQEYGDTWLPPREQISTASEKDTAVRRQFYHDKLTGLSQLSGLTHGMNFDHANAEFTALPPSFAFNQNVGAGNMNLHGLESACLPPGFEPSFNESFPSQIVHSLNESMMTRKNEEEVDVESNVGDGDVVVIVPKPQASQSPRILPMKRKALSEYSAKAFVKNVNVNVKPSQNVSDAVKNASLQRNEKNKPIKRVTYGKENHDPSIPNPISGEMSPRPGLVATRETRPRKAKTKSGQKDKDSDYITDMDDGEFDGEFAGFDSDLESMFSGSNKRGSSSHNNVELDVIMATRRGNNGKRPYFRKSKYPKAVLDKIQAQRLVVKRAKNRELAAKSRQRKKDRIEMLEKENENLEIENKKLLDKLKRAEKDKEKLEKQLTLNAKGDCLQKNACATCGCKEENKN